MLTDPLFDFVMCYARSTEDSCVALVCPNPIALKALGKELALTDKADDIKALCEVYIDDTYIHTDKADVFKALCEVYISFDLSYLSTSCLCYMSSASC